MKSQKISRSQYLLVILVCRTKNLLFEDILRFSLNALFVILTPTGNSDYCLIEGLLSFRVKRLISQWLSTNFKITRIAP